MFASGFSANKIKEKRKKILRYMGNQTKNFAHFDDDILPVILSSFSLIANTDKLKMQQYFSA